MPSCPMMFLQGTWTSSKNTSAVSDDHIPILSIFRAMCIPTVERAGNKTSDVMHIGKGTLIITNAVDRIHTEIMRRGCFRITQQYSISFVNSVELKNLKNV